MGAFVGVLQASLIHHQDDMMMLQQTHMQPIRVAARFLNVFMPLHLMRNDIEICMYSMVCRRNT
jgi:hypothetical protein